MQFGDDEQFMAPSGGDVHDCVAQDEELLGRQMLREEIREVVVRSHEWDLDAVLFDDFTSDDSFGVWKRDVTLFGDGNGWAQRVGERQRDLAHRVVGQCAQRRAGRAFGRSPGPRPPRRHRVMHGV